MALLKWLIYISCDKNYCLTQQSLISNNLIVLTTKPVSKVISKQIIGRNICDSFGLRCNGGMTIGTISTSHLQGVHGWQLASRKAAIR